MSTFQNRVAPWMQECFGAEISSDTIERNHRFIEEALELVQACGCSRADAIRLVDYVYARPVGVPEQEVGGVMVTLAALCLAQGMDMHLAGDVELERIWTKVEAIRAKQASKPKGALPQDSGWQIGAVRQKLSDGEGSKVWEVPGWVCGDFGIDYRVYIGCSDCGEQSGPCYALTYLPNGLLIACFCSTLAEVQAFADTVATHLSQKEIALKIDAAGQATAEISIGRYVLDAQALHNLYPVNCDNSVAAPRFDRWIMEERAQ